ncbi:MAG: substrate-binding domain-containing protein [Acidimicrobiales bacterium]|nr:substrate-binding domain-containing protein [Acidimicrobiales bacterium]
MFRSKRRIATLVAVLLSLSLVAAACGDDDDDSTSDTTEATTATTGGSETTSGGGAPTGVSGSVVVTGSSTVEPISAAVAQALSDANPDLSIEVSGPGTGDGMEIFCSGGADVTGASRAIKDEEAAACAEAGVEFVELKVGDDGITVATSPNNEAVTCLDFGALYALVGPESTGFSSWSDANELAATVGSAFTDLPDAPLAITGPGEESGTYDFFVETVIAPIAETQGLPEEEWQTRPDYTASPNDNVIVEGIEGSDTSLGWVGFAFYQEEQGRMKAIEVDGGDGCVGPTPETIADGTYPISRPLFIYVDVAKAQDNPAVAAFVDYYLSDEGIANVTDVGYVAEPAADLEAARSAWSSAVGG